MDSNPCAPVLPLPNLPLTLKSAQAVDCEILPDVVGPVPGRDFVTTFPPPDPCEETPMRGGRLTRNLAKGRDISKVRGWAVKEQVVRLHCFEGKSLKQTAALIGRSYGHVQNVWALVKRECNDPETAEKRRGNVRAYMDSHLRNLIELGAKGFADSAAHGAVALQSLVKLGELHGIKPEETAAAGATLPEIGARVRAISPLLADRLEQVAAMKAAVLAADSEGLRRASGSGSPEIEGEPIRPAFGVVVDEVKEGTTCYNGANAESESCASH